MIRALQAQEAEVDPETAACLMAYLMGGFTEAANDVGGDGGEVEDETDDSNPLSFLEDVDYANTDVCDYTTGVGICDISDTAIECDESDESTMKIIFNDMLMCKESMPEGEGPPVDMIINNIPYCVPKICPDDSNMVELMIMFLEMFVGAFEQGLEEGGETVTVTPTEGDGVVVDDPTAELEAFTKQQCDSGTKLSSTTTEEDAGDNDHSGDHSGEDGSHDSGDSSGDDSSGAAVKNMIWSFSVAAAVGIGSFLVV